MRKIFVLLFGTIVIISCDTTKNQTITKDNVEASANKIKEDTDLDSLKIDLLDNLIAISKGRDEYIQSRLKKNDKSSIEKYVVSSEKFDENVDNLFSYFIANKVTYKMLLTEIDTLKSLTDKRESQLESAYVEVDELCKKKQFDIEEKERKAKVIKDSLNKMIDLKIISIKETEIDYRDVVQVAIQMTNKTNKKIEAISFNMELRDKLGTNLGTLRCRSNDGFLKSDVGYWTYDRWDNDEMYKSLRNTNVSHVTTTKEITKLNIAGELISAYNDLEDFAIDYSYKSPKKLAGYCPYLDDNDDLNKKIEKQHEQTSKEIKDKLKIFTKYNDFNSKLFDFSQLLK